MTEKTIPVEPEVIACEVCLKEIPESVAQSMEGDDYIHHFCGLECYNTWQDSENKSTPKAANE